MELTDEYRALLRALLSNPLHPDISADHAETLIAMGLATRWADRLAITLAGRRAAYPDAPGTDELPIKPRRRCLSRSAPISVLIFCQRVERPAV